ncbi:MAG: helix-turn-helix domain-containing protein [Acidimicrobiales bacterium]
MGYRGKTVEHERARELRAAGWTYNEICAELGVSKSSVSLWVRDIEVDEEVWGRRARANKRFGAHKRKNRLEMKRHAEIERLHAEARDQLGQLSEREFLVAGVALYAGEGANGDGAVKFANRDPRMILMFLSWLRTFFDVDESRLRIRLYLHQGLDLAAAIAFWSDLTGIPTSQFGKPHRAVPDPSIRRAKHPMGCPAVAYACTRTHRSIMGLVHALLSCEPLPG